MASLILCCFGGLASFGVTSFSAPPAQAESESAQLERKLSSARDFRVRMQAALDLGRIKARASRHALEKALEDESAAVRAAAAAALKTLGDRQALPALHKASNDRSDAVRNQVAAAIKGLETQAEATFLVQVGEVESDASASEGRVKKALRRAAQRRLRRLPEVMLKTGESAPNGLQQLVLDARISRVQVKKLPSRVEVSAKVDFILSSLPGHEIKGRLSGAATVHGEAKALKRPKELGRLRLEAVEAATDVALQNVDRALKAVAD